MYSNSHPKHMANIFKIQTCKFLLYFFISVYFSIYQMSLHKVCPLSSVVTVQSNKQGRNDPLAPIKHLRAPELCGQ